MNLRYVCKRGCPGYSEELAGVDALMVALFIEEEWPAKRDRPRLGKIMREIADRDWATQGPWKIELKKRWFSVDLDAPSIVSENDDVQAFLIVATKGQVEANAATLRGWALGVIPMPPQVAKAETP
jgi:hypothetical protein